MHLFLKPDAGKNKQSMTKHMLSVWNILSSHQAFMFQANK